MGYLTDQDFEAARSCPRVPLNAKQLKQRRIQQFRASLADFRAEVNSEAFDDSEITKIFAAIDLLDAAADLIGKNQ